MTAPAPITLNNWDVQYGFVLQDPSLSPEVAKFFFDLVETINQLHESHNDLEARVAALEP